MQFGALLLNKQKIGETADEAFFGVAGRITAYLEL